MDSLIKEKVELAQEEIKTYKNVNYKKYDISHPQKKKSQSIYSLRAGHYLFIKIITVRGNGKS